MDGTVINRQSSEDGRRVVKSHFKATTYGIIRNTPVIGAPSLREMLGKTRRTRLRDKRCGGLWSKVGVELADGRFLVKPREGGRVVRHSGRYMGN